MNSNLTICPMQKEHVPAVSRLEQETFSMPWSAQDFLDMIEREGALYIVALYEEQPVGVCGVTNYHVETGKIMLY